MADRFKAGGHGYGEAKKALFEKMWSYFEPFRKKREELAQSPELVESILQQGAERARTEARVTLRAVRQAVGLE